MTVATTLPAQAVAPVPDYPGTVAEGFLQTVQRYPQRIAVRSVDGETSLTWLQVRRRVECLAAGLQRLGVRRGDTVALLLKNRPEFLLADVAAMCLGAAPFSLYTSLPAVQIVPQLHNADARLVITESVFLPQILEARESCPELRHVVVLDGGAPPQTTAWAQLETAAGDFDLDAAVAAVAPEDLATLVYTSGTTGPAKGVELPHAALVAAVRTSSLLLGRNPESRFLSWLPTAGMAERITSHYIPLINGGTVTYCSDPRLAAEALPKAAPHIFFAPPRFWERLRLAIEARWASLPPADRSAMERALRIGLEKLRLEQAGRPVPLQCLDDWRRADRELFAPLRRSLGLGADDLYVASGGASAPVALLEFFHAIGLPLDEAYGLTESSSFGTRNPRGGQRLGTVGKAQPGVDVRLAGDGEILIRAPAMMRGYRKRPDATAAAIGPEGWLHTGDIGSIDAQGYFRILDRKNDVIANSFGKKMSPANIEAALTASGPFISQAVVIGDGRNYNVALLTLDCAHAVAWALENGLDDPNDVEALARDPLLIAVVDAQVRRASERLARVEQIKKFDIVGGEWLPGSDEVTPTMKIRRRVIAQKYAARIEALYAQEGAGRAHQAVGKG